MEQHIPLVRAICKRMGVKRPIEDSEEFAEGCLALVKYAPRYDGRGPISTYLYACIRGCILRLRKKRMQDTGVAKTRHGLEGYQPFVPLEDVMQTTPVHREVFVPPVVQDALRRLTPRLREYIHRHFVEGESMREIGRSEGLSANRVHQLLASALRKVRMICGPISSSSRALNLVESSADISSRPSPSPTPAS